MRGDEGRLRRLPAGHLSALADITFHDTILALYIAGAVVGFGVTFAYPVMMAWVTRSEPSNIPVVWRAISTVSQRVVVPGLVVVLAAGIYLAADGHQWGKFYVDWGIAAIVVMGGLGGALLTPTERRLAEVAERDLAGGGGGGAFSEEYQRLRRRWNLAGTATWVLILVTVFMMANHVGA